MGFSVWWCVAAGGRQWLSLAGAPPARRVTGRNRMRPQPRWPIACSSGWASGSVWRCLMYGSTSMEWARLYSLEPHLPGHSGGAMGYWLGQWSVKWLGFAGAGPGSDCRWAWSAPRWCFAFPWMRAAERIGGWIDAIFETQREKRELAQDLEMGQQALREREEVYMEEREEVEMHHPQPVVIEPVIVDLPPSVRVAKERQKPLFSEMPDSKLPQVDLLDGAQARQETVSPETLEMTSRMIEKKLKDFRRGSARGAGPAGPGDYALRDRARHRREGLADRRLGQRLGAVVEPGVHPRGGDHSRQELHGAGAAQRQAAKHQALRNFGLAGLQRSQVHADHGAGQGHRRQPRRGRSGQDAARAGGGYYRLGQVGRYQRDDSCRCCTRPKRAMCGC